MNQAPTKASRRTEAPAELIVALGVMLLGATLVLATVTPIAVAGAVVTALGAIAVTVVARRFAATPRWDALGFAIVTAAAGAAVLALAWNGLQIDPLARVGLPLGAFSPSDLLLVAAAGLLGILAVSGRRFPVAVPKWILGPALALAATALLAKLAGGGAAVETPTVSRTARALINTNLESPLRALLALELGLVLVPLVLSAVAATPRRATVFATLWLLSATASALFAFTDTVGLTNMTELTGAATRDLRATGLAGHPNHLGLASALALPVAVLGISGRLPGRVPLHVVAAFMLGFAVTVSGSRAAFAAAVAASLLTALLIAGGRRRLALVGAVLVVGGLAVVAGVSLTGVEQGAYEETDAVARFGQSQSGQESFETRSELRERALDQFAANPLTGVSFRQLKTAHNIYLQLASSGGILALGAFAVFIAGALALAWRLLRRARFATPQRMLVVALLVAFCTWLGAGMIGNTVTDGYLYLPVGLMLALELYRRRAPAAGAGVAHSTAVSASSSADSSGPVGGGTTGRSRLASS